MSTHYWTWNCFDGLPGSVSWLAIWRDSDGSTARSLRDCERSRPATVWVGFDLGGNIFEMLAVSERPQYERPRYQVGFEVEDIEAARVELIQRGVVPISEIEGSEATSRWADFRDPEGNVFEISQRRTH